MDKKEMRYKNKRVENTSERIERLHHLYDDGPKPKHYADGKVGIGEDSPGTLLSLKGGADTSIITLKCTKNDSSWAGNTIGAMYFYSEDGSGPGAGIRGSINYFATSSSGGDTAMSFKTGDNTERMRIDNSGNVLISKQSLNISSVGTEFRANGQSFFTCDGDNSIDLNRLTNEGGIAIFRQAGTVVGNISVTSSATTYNTSSDYRLKEDLQDFAGLDMVSKIPVYDFKWKVDDSRSYGVLAHELEEVLPQAVDGEKDAKEMQSVDYSKIVPVLVKAIQELKAEVDLLKQECKCK